MHQGLLYPFVGWSDLSIEVALLKVKLSEIWLHMNTLSHFLSSSIQLHLIRQISEK